MRSNSLQVDLAIKAPAQKVWDFIADWEGQSEWMLQTKVFLTSEKSKTRKYLLMKILVAGCQIGRAHV